MKQSKRAKIPIDTQVSVFFRDGWICRWCDSPTVFAPSLKYIQKLTGLSKSEHKLAYYDLHYRRDRAPLLDLLAATIDHLVPFSRGGNDTVENFVTACNKCNMRKSDCAAEDFARENLLRPVGDRPGEPTTWDGLTSFFLMIAQQHPKRLTSHERNWLNAIAVHIGSYG